MSSLPFSCECLFECVCVSVWCELLSSWMILIQSSPTACLRKKLNADMLDCSHACIMPAGSVMLTIFATLDV